MVSPKSPGRTEVRSARRTSSDITKFGPKIKKFFPQFDELTTKQKGSLATAYALQDVMLENYGKDDELYKKRYSNEAIKARGLAFLGVKTEKDERYRELPIGPAGATLAKREPLAQGGRVHRGRTASGSAEK